MTVTATVAAAFVFGPLLWPVDPHLPATDALSFAAPSAAHPLGTDEQARDVLARVLAGGRLALHVGLGTALITLTVGLALGLPAGWLGGPLDAVVRRAADVALAFPGILLALLVMHLAPPDAGAWTVVFALAATGWAGPCRVVRALTVQLRTRPWVVAARCLGASHARMLTRHLLPAVLGPAAVHATFSVAGAILGEASLSFLGLGPRGVVSWGALLEEGAATLLRSPRLVVSTAMALLSLQVGLNLLADGLRDRLDPRAGGANLQHLSLAGRTDAHR
jgi:peptide/nickel transport system permease protein